MAFSPRQERFIQEYLIDLNATQAAIRSGYSAATAGSQGQRLLKNVDIKKAIEHGKKKHAETVTMDRRRILEELTVIASVNVNDIWDFSGKKPRLRPAHLIPPHARRAIAAIEVNGSMVKVKLWDKHKALALLAQHIGLLKEIHEVTAKVEATGKEGGPIQTEVKHGFDGDLTPYLNLISQFAEGQIAAGFTPDPAHQPVPGTPSQAQP